MIHDKGDNDSENPSDVLKHANLLLCPNTSESCSLQLNELVFTIMRKDAISTGVREDTMLCTYGSFLIAGKGAKKVTYISHNLRLLARLLISLRQKHGVNSELMEFLQPDFVMILSPRRNHWLDIWQRVQTVNLCHLLKGLPFP